MARPTKESGVGDTASVAPKPSPNAAPSKAASKAKVTARRKRKAAQVILRAGKPQDPGSFVTLDQPEATVAAYCGFNDIGTFRRFYTSPLVLHSYNKSLAYRGFNKKHTLALLEDVPYDSYWKMDNDPLMVYPMEDVGADEKKNNRNYGMGLIAWQMLRAIRKGLLGDDARTQTERDAFEKFTSCKLPQASSSSLSEGILMPSFGPFDGECELEALNRCLCLLAHIRFAVSPSQWNRRFFGTSPWDKSVAISIEYVPDWMQHRDAAAGDLLAELPDEFVVEGTAKEEEPREITVTWKEKSKHRKNAAFVEQMNDQDILSDVPRSIVVNVASNMPPPQIRDQIRHDFKLHQVEGQLEKLTLHINDDTDDSESQKDFPALGNDWASIWETLSKYPSKEAGPSPSFSCLFRLLDDGESPWEFDGPPPVVSNFVERKDGDVVSKQNLEPEHVGQVKQQIFEMTVPNLETPFDPLKLFGGKKDRMIKYYNGYDVSQPEELRIWQLKFLPLLAECELPARYNGDEKLKGFRLLSEAQRAILTAASHEGSMHTVDLEQADGQELDSFGEDARAAYDRYYAYQTAVGGTKDRVGPPIDLSVKALHLNTAKDEQGREVYAFINLESDQVRRKFKPYQVNGAAWGLSTLFGKIPFAEDSDYEIQAAAEVLKRLAVPGIMYTDATGLGKSILLLLTISICRSRPVAYDDAGRPIYKPLFLAVPQNLIRPWAREILFDWPMFELIISYHDGSMEPYLAEHVVSSSAVREWPKQTHWPKKYAYVFDKYDSRNARTIFLTTPETHAERSMWKEVIQHPPEPYDPPKFDKDNEQVYQTLPWEETIYHTRLANVFSMVLVDEATKIKTVGSHRHMAIAMLEAPFYIFMTATPMMNQGTCILGPLVMIWDAIKKRFESRSKEEQQWVAQRLGSLSVFHDASALEENDVRRLAILNPHSVKLLLESNDGPLIAQWFPIIEDLIVLRRTTASQIPYDAERKSFFSIRDTIQPHHMKTRVLARDSSEDAEFEWMHRDAARRYLEAKMNPGKATAETSSPLGDESKVVFGTAEMREMIIITGSTQAALFNAMCGRLDSDTKVAMLDQHRQRGWTAVDVVKFMCRASKQPMPKTAFDLAKYMIHGSPMLRGLIFELWKHLKDTQALGKVLVTEQVPVLAWWWDLTLNCLGLRTTTFHSGLAVSDRDKMISRFNDPSNKDLMVMILPYDVGALGLNLQGDCNKVVVMSAAHNQSSETQAIFRPVRVNSPRQVYITKMFVENSLCAFRESKKTDKYVVELATRAKDPIIQALCVDMLNEYHKEVQAAQDTPENKQLMDELILQRAQKEQDKKQREENARSAKTIPERQNCGINTSNIIKSTRSRKKPERFGDLEWSDGGTRVGVISETERQEREALIGDEDASGNGFSNGDDEHDDPWLDDTDICAELDLDSEQESEFAVSEEDEIEEEEFRELPMTEKQRAKMEHREAKRSMPKFDEGTRQLVKKLLDKYDRVYTKDDLNEHVHLIRALKLLHSKKLGIPFDEVEAVHVKYTRLPQDMVSSFEKIGAILKKQKKLLQHLLAGRREKDFSKSAAKGPASSAKGARKSTAASTQDDADGKKDVLKKQGGATKGEGEGTKRKGPKVAELSSVAGKRKVTTAGDPAKSKKKQKGGSMAQKG